MATAILQTVRQGPASTSLTAASLAERVNLIRTSPLFSDLTTDQCADIARQARPKVFARDEMLFMQGQPVRDLALIRTGSVKIMQLGPNGNEAILWIHGVGNVVGGLSEPISSYHSCSARAMEQSTALVWEYAALQDLMQKYPQIRRNISQILFSRLNELEERFREVATEKVAKRVALALLRLVKHIGKKVHGGVEISLSREELAQMTGTTLFTTSRLLSKWGEMGFLSPGRESVLVRDPSRLELVSDDL
ncbi:MAG: Crp/Fnr family transcriptional regulator [Terracidiphilus sp.]|jgi:CRP-like cAMP-binding protein